MSRRAHIAGFALLGLAEVAIFFNSPRHFFIGDTLTWMGFRYRSFGEFLAGFLQTDPRAWYRPLSQRTVISALYPFAGLNPFAYRVAGFLLFFACTVTVFFFVRQLAQSSRAAWFAVLLFAPNVTHAFTTFDAAFFPEILFTMFCIGSLMAFVRKRWFLSAALFVGGLLSKETAVALPFAILAAWLLLPKTERGPARSLLPHFAILIAYLVLAIGYLHVRDIHPRQFIERPGHLGQEDYQIVAGHHVLENMHTALTWTFGIPRLDYTEDMLPARLPVRWSLAALQGIRVILLAGFVLALFFGFESRRRYLVLLGLGWFVAMLSPTIAIPNHFLPYYLFAPLVGFALAAGVVLDWGCEQCTRISPRLGVALCAAILVISGGIQARAANRLSARHDLLGQSALHAENSVNDLRNAHPTLSPNSLIVIYNEEYPLLAWDHAYGTLFTLAYDDPSLAVWYSADGGQPPLERYPPARVVAFKWTNNHLVDATSAIKPR